jgi:hypothetical protein
MEVLAQRIAIQISRKSRMRKDDQGRRGVRGRGCQNLDLEIVAPAVDADF